MQRNCSGSRRPALLHGDISMTVSIHCTTGGRFEVSVSPEETVDGLKRRLAHKLRIHKDRLILLHRDARLDSGKLQDSGVVDGSRLTLMPAVEAGLMSQSWQPEQSVLQALESLSDAQVSDFLSGRSPLTLALRMGDHIMFVQLQLAIQPSVSRGPNQSDPQHSMGPIPPSPHAGHAHRGQSPAHAPPCFQPHGGTDRQRHKPDAVIESLVSHAPGVFSGTFSGTLYQNCQDGPGRPRRDITTILQILNDLLSATHHLWPRAAVTLAHLRCQMPCPPSAPFSPPPSPISDGQPLGRLRRPSGERLRQTENKATRCKVKQLRLLLRQRRLRRRARRDQRGPWASRRRAARAHSAGSDESLDLDFDPALWNTDMNAEFVMA